MSTPTPGTKQHPNKIQRRFSWAFAVTTGLLGVIALLLGVAQGYLALTVIASVAFLVGSFRYLLGSSRAFSLALANLIGIYACVFLFFAESSFEQVGVKPLSIGFLMPLLSFLAGSLRRRDDIRQVARSRSLQGQRNFARILAWLLPVAAIGAMTFFLPHGPGAAQGQLAALLGAMAAISAIVFVVSHDVAVFLLDTGLLFEEFFERMSRLIVPAFAFLTFYSLLIILFASFYSIADHLSHAPNFRVDGAVRALNFPEALYFSLTTLSTVGYGDISPTSSIARLLTAIEIVCGILLLLFGFNEIFSFAREHPRHYRHDEPMLDDRDE